MDVFLKVSLITTLWMCQTGVLSAPRKPRLSLAESMPTYYYTNINGYPGTYAFGYDVLDPVTGNTQYRTEERYSNGTVVGSYGYVDAFGRPHRYRYVADDRGYRVMREVPNQFHGGQMTNYPSTESPMESSVTWTRPKKTGINRTNDIERKNYLNPYINAIERPSFNVGYPLGQNELEDKNEMRDEKEFPNGTVIGRYNYTDKEGNPIQVKYYADDKSYGVEMKSVKIIDMTSETSSLPNNQKTIDYLSKSTEPSSGLGSDFVGTFNYPNQYNKNKNSDSINHHNKETLKIKPYRTHQNPQSDFEVYTGNDFKASNNCKDNVRVYYEKSKREIYDELNEVSKYCEQF